MWVDMHTHELTSESLSSSPQWQVWSQTSSELTSRCPVPPPELPPEHLLCSSASGPVSDLPSSPPALVAAGRGGRGEAGREGEGEGIRAREGGRESGGFRAK